MNKFAQSMAIVIALLMVGEVCAAVFPESRIGPLHYETDAAFNAAFRQTLASHADSMSVQSVAGDGVVLRQFGNKESRVWDARNAANNTDISAFPLEAGQPVLLYTDFRIQTVDKGVPVKNRVALAAVSLDDRRSYVGSFYIESPGTLEGLMRFENFNLVDNTRVAAYTAQTTPYTPFSTEKWYRLEMTLTRLDASRVKLNLSMYNLVGDAKGGAKDTLIKSFSEIRENLVADGMSNAFQFGLKADASGGARTVMDNFGAYVVPPAGTVIAIR
ncbi:MAG: hypothetical protein ACOX9C_12815 [Kiritimatiellia bacterium]|jgi:hypothetical protein